MILGPYNKKIWRSTCNVNTWRSKGKESWWRGTSTDQFLLPSFIFGWHLEEPNICLPLFVYLSSVDNIFVANVLNSLLLRTTWINMFFIICIIVQCGWYICCQCAQYFAVTNPWINMFSSFVYLSSVDVVFVTNVLNILLLRTTWINMFFIICIFFQCGCCMCC